MTIGFYIDVIFEEKRLGIRVIQDDENIRWIACVDIFRVASERYSADGRIKLQVNTAVLAAMNNVSHDAICRQYGDFGLDKGFANKNMKCLLVDYSALYLKASGFAPTDAEAIVSDLNKAADEFLINYAKEKKEKAPEEPEERNARLRAKWTERIEAGPAALADELLLYFNWVEGLAKRLKALDGILPKLDVLSGRIGAIERVNAAGRLAQLEEDFSDLERNPPRQKNGMTESEFVLKEANRLYAKGKALREEGR